MSQRASDPAADLGFTGLRQAILDCLQSVRGSLNDPQFAKLPEDLSADASFLDLELDSLSAMEFCLEMEDRTGLEIEPGELLAYPSVNALAARLSEMAAAPSS